MLFFLVGVREADGLLVLISFSALTSATLFDVIAVDVTVARVGGVVTVDPLQREIAITYHRATSIQSSDYC